MNLPRIMIAAPASGSGKTLATCGILQALVNRGLEVASFKCGPDYIDPMFHSRVIGTRSKNLDAYFVKDDVLRYLFGRTAEACDISVVEGVMGFYDGIAMDSTEASSYDVSQKLGIPVVLLVNCRGASISALAMLKGFLEFRENNIRGIIFNNMSEKVFLSLKDAVREMGVEPVGYIPRVSDLVLESRHLGLVLPSEIGELKDKLNRLAEVLEGTLDMDLLIGIANNAPGIEYRPPEVVPASRKVRVGFADDEVFCFTYEDNIELLERCGAEIVRFSPLNDPHLPDVDGIVLSGGYPELHADGLEANRAMMSEIKQRIAEGMPCIAECGGFMYLHEEMEDSEGKMHRMCGAVPGKVANAGKLTRFGYASFAPSEKGMMPTATGIRGHEFHYWDSDDCGEDWEAVKTNGRRYRCMHDTGTLLAGFPHLYYYSDPRSAASFLEKCIGYSDMKNKS